MANADEELTVAQRLGRALDRGLLPAGGPAEAAERLIERLERPARIALLGLPGSGKSSILNLLVGAIVVPETLRLPTIIVQHGDVARMICTLTDGSTKILPGSDLADVLPLAPALVTLEMDLAALKVISLLEVSAGPMEAEQKRAASWASKRADIVIWCTTSYLPKEQVVWESLPDAVKDNSFMFLTKVDLLGSRQSASAMHDRVELRAGEEFRQILSISAKEARAAMPPGGPVNRDLFRDSGALAVIGAIKTRVQSGRRADMDTVELLLARHVEASEMVARRFAEPGESADTGGPWTPPPEPAEAEPVADIEAQDAHADATPAAEEAAPDVHEQDEAEADVEEPADQPDEVAEDEAALVEAEVELEAEPEAEAEPEPEPGPALAAEDVTPPADPPQAQPASRKRFADRIKRVATEGDPALAPMVPLRSTWKSKSELEAPPEPEPAARPQEPVRRPRPSAQPTTDEGDLAKILASVTSDPEATPEVVSEVASEAVPEPTEPPRERVPRDRPARALTPRPQPPADAADSEGSGSDRPRLFGAGRNAEGLARGAPLPDLSSLRARPEEMAEAEEAEGPGSEAAYGDLDPIDAVDIDTGEDAADPVEEMETAAADEGEPAAEVAPDTEPEVEVAPRPAAPVERPRLFGREPRARPAEPVAPPREPPPPTAPPMTRLPASARAASAAAQPAASTAADEALFSPRAIMTRERPTGTDQSAPRRERPRIAARAVPAAAAPAAPVPEIGADAGLADQAVAVILARAAELESEIDPDAKVPVDLILDHTRETGEQVIAVVSQGRSDAMRRINSDLGEVLDVIMLMQLEKGHAPADDALTMLLQLRRELETLRAV